MDSVDTIEEIKNNEDDYVTVYGRTISSDEMCELIEALKSNHVLKDLTIYTFPYGNPKQMSDLFKTLQNHPALKKLTIATYTPITPDNIDALNKLITSSTTKLQELSLDNKACTDQGLNNLLPAIINSPSLIKFHYFMSTAKNEAIMKAATKLIKESKLQAIYFYLREPGNNITHPQIQALVEALKENSKQNNTLTVKDLCISLTDYEPQALQPLFDYILDKDSSLPLELTLGSINDTNTLQALVKAMKHNTLINDLTIEIIPTIENAERMLKLVTVNNTLTRLDFWSMGDPIGNPDKFKKIEEQIEAQLLENKAKQERLQASISSDDKHSRKRSAYLDVFSTTDLKRQRPSADEDTSRNTKPPSEDPPSNTTIHVRS